TMSAALSPAALWAGPILYFAALLILLALGHWKGQLAPALAAAIVLGTSPRVYDDFAYAVPGHHGWHDLACFATLILLAAAIGNGRSSRLFIAAGVAGAIALWIGVTQQAFGFAAAGAGAIAGMIWSKRREPSEENSATKAINLLRPESWRAFGIAGAAAALAFYGLEYGPAPLTMRLEVNHPIYALAFFLGGELLCRTQRLLLGKASCRSDSLWAVVSAIGLLAIGGIIFFGPMEWHAMRQPFMRRLHQEIAEFQPIMRSQGAASFLILGPPIFLIGVAFWRMGAHCLTVRYRMA